MTEQWTWIIPSYLNKIMGRTDEKTFISELSWYYIKVRWRAGFYLLFTDKSWCVWNLSRSFVYFPLLLIFSFIYKSMELWLFSLYFTVNQILHYFFVTQTITALVISNSFRWLFVNTLIIVGFLLMFVFAFLALPFFMVLQDTIGKK